MTVDEPVLVRDLNSLPPFAGDGFASRILVDETVGVDHVSVGVVEFDPGVRHAHENTGDEVLRKRWIFAPQGPERAIRERGATGGDDDE